MEEHVNNLSPAELERLAILAEECGEVVQVVNKIIRHGYDDYSPFDETKTPNRSKLESELGDLMFMVKFMTLRNDIDTLNILLHSDHKRDTINQWFRHNEIKENEL